MSVILSFPSCPPSPLAHLPTCLYCSSWKPVMLPLPLTFIWALQHAWLSLAHPDLYLVGMYWNFSHHKFFGQKNDTLHFYSNKCKCTKCAKKHTQKNPKMFSHMCDSLRKLDSQTKKQINKQTSHFFVWLLYAWDLNLKYKKSISPKYFTWSR